jgi:anti-sigma factor RsiW
MTGGDQRHERYEELAVGHVLGGLDAGEAASLRAHLLGCERCRMRVAELRGIAAELAAAERDERQHARLRTEVTRRADLDAPDERTPRQLGARHLLVGAMLVVAVVGAMAFWNLHLRSTAATYGEVAGQRGDVLRELATGVPVTTEVADGLSAIVVVDGTEVAFSVAGLPALREGELAVVWLVDTAEGGTAPALFARAGQLADGVFAGQVADREARRLVITLERGVPSDGPSGPELVSAELRPRLSPGTGPPASPEGA